MEGSFFSKPLSQSEYRIKITSQLLSKSECRNLGHDLTQKTQRNKMAEGRNNADKSLLGLQIWLHEITPTLIEPSHGETFAETTLYTARLHSRFFIYYIVIFNGM